MTILETLWDIVVATFYTILILYILYGICEFFDWIEYKRFEKDTTEYFKRKHEREFLERYDYDLHLQYMMREWNW